MEIRTQIGCGRDWAVTRREQERLVNTRANKLPYLTIR